jgi:hypothetical protein
MILLHYSTMSTINKALQTAIVIIIVLVTTNTVWQSTNIDQNTKLGVIAGVIFTLSLTVIHLLPKNKLQWVAAGALLTLIAPLAIGGFWFSDGHLGISDWDYHFFNSHYLRQIVTEHKQFPLWNPFPCGGTAGLADPEFSILTPTFPLILLFGEAIGLRLSIYLSIIVMSLGMLLLTKRLKLSVEASLLTAIGVTYGGYYIIKLVEGHIPIVFPSMWIPWVFWSWYVSYQKITNGSFSFKKPSSYTSSLLCGIFLSLMFFQGGIYPLLYVGFALLLISLLINKHLLALFTTTTAAIWALGLSGVKLIPMILWTSQFQDQNYAISTYTLPHLSKILLSRILHTPDEIIPKQASGWHEYGAYLGYFIIILALISLINLKRNRIILLLSVTALLALLLSSAGPLLEPLFDRTSFFPRSNISRTIIFFIISLSLLAGFGLDTIKKLLPKLTFLPPLLIGLVAIELMSFSYPLSNQAFVLPNDRPPKQLAEYPIAFTVNQHVYRYNGVDYNRAYTSAKSGYGTFSYCSPLSPKPAVFAVEHGEYTSYATLNPPNGTLEITKWSPNKITITANTTQTSKLVLNTNYAKGWHVNNKPAIDVSGRLAVKLSPGSHQLTFQYKPPGFKTGFTITTLTLLLLIFLKIKKPRQ